MFTEVEGMILSVRRIEADLEPVGLVEIRAGHMDVDSIVELVWLSFVSLGINRVDDKRRIRQEPRLLRDFHSSLSPSYADFNVPCAM